MIVRGASEADMAKLQEVKGYTVRKPDVIHPRVIIYDVPTEIAKNEEVFVRDLQARNFPGRSVDEVKGEVRYVSRRTSNVKPFRGTDDDVVNVIIAIAGETQRRILEKKSLFLGYRVCKVREEVNSQGCFKCFRYGHRKDRCNMEEEVCRNCCEPGHFKDKCPLSEPVCINCKRDGLPCRHGVLSVDCPLQGDVVSRGRARIQYD